MNADFTGFVLSHLAEPWRFAFLQRGLLAVILVALSCASIGAYVVLRRLSFIGDGLAHATLGGLAVGFMLKINALVAALAAALLTALGIGFVSRRAELSLDTAIGIMFSGMFASGIVIISHDHNYRGDLFDLLLGNMLAVGVNDLILCAATCFFVLAFLFYFHKELFFSTFDPQGAAASGVPVAWLDFGLLALLALTITTALQTVGVVLVSALLVTPAASALQLTNRFPQMIFLSILFGMVSGLSGIYLSYYLDVPCGAAVVLASTAIFFGCLLAGPKRRKVIIYEPEAAFSQGAIEGDFHRID